MVDNYIHTLPIYLLYLPDMRLVHRSAVKDLINPGIDEMVKTYKDMSGSAIQQEENIKKVLMDGAPYAIFSHRWLPEGELTFQDLSKLQSITAAGFSRLIESPKEELKVLSSAAILDRGSVFSEGDAERNGLDVFEQMKGICDSMLDQDHCAGGFVKLVRFCEVALQRKCKYVWLDTGCINKQNSAELQESIRSMFHIIQSEYTLDT
jgi:hypothetical protein